MPDPTKRKGHWEERCGELKLIMEEVIQERDEARWQYLDSREEIGRLKFRLLVELDEIKKKFMELEDVASERAERAETAERAKRAET